MKPDPIKQVTSISETDKAKLLRVARAAAVAALGSAECSRPPASVRTDGGRVADIALTSPRHGESQATRRVASDPAPLPPRPGESRAKRRLQDPRKEANCEALTPTPLPPGEGERIVGRFGGVFVTLWNGPKLRGCVGTVLSTDDICEAVQHVTRSSLMDPRFRDQPVELGELPAITIEISLLSDPFPMRNPADLICGVHGVIVHRGGRSGCFLPKVAAERGWSAEVFLSNCCKLKAGLPADAWRDPATFVQLFTAVALSDVAK